MKKRNNISCLTTHELAEYVLKTGTIPIPDYSKEKPTDLIVQ